MQQTTNLENFNFTGLMINSAGVKAFGSIYAAFILSILVRRYFECQQSGDLTPAGAFTCPKMMLEHRIGLKSPTINKHLRVLKKKGAIVVTIGKPGEPRLFTINEKIIQTVSCCLNRGAGEIFRKGGRQ